MSKLLIDEYPLIVLPSLAMRIGVSQAIVLQQIHFWCETNKRQNNPRYYKDGYWWAIATNKKWLEQFPFWSMSGLKQILNKLRTPGDHGPLLIERRDGNGRGRAVWYRVNYNALPVDEKRSDEQEESSADFYDPHL